MPKDRATALNFIDRYLETERQRLTWLSMDGPYT